MIQKEKIVLSFNEDEFLEKCSDGNDIINTLNAIYQKAKDLGVIKAIPNIHEIIFEVMFKRKYQGASNPFLVRKNFLTDLVRDALEKKYLDNGLELYDAILQKHIDRYWKELYSLIACSTSQMDDYEYKTFIQWNNETENFFLKDGLEKVIREKYTRYTYNVDGCKILDEAAIALTKALNKFGGLPREVVELFEYQDGKFIPNHRVL